MILPGRTDRFAEETEETLAALLGNPMAPGEFLPLAIALCAALRERHLRGTPYLNLAPGTIRVDLKSCEVTLGEPPAEEKQEGNVGGPFRQRSNPAYLSPEGTGKIGREPDQRSDLYSLGVIYYQMLTGTLPFEARNRQEWVYCHIACAPPAPVELVPKLPPTLSEMVLRLLAKDPDDRYQSAAALQADLETCLATWQGEGIIPSFPLGAVDLGEMLLPQRSYADASDRMLVSYLLEMLMRMVLQNAGAKKGHLMIAHDGELMVEAEGWVEEDGIEVALQVMAPRADLVPISVVNQVLRTGRRVVVDDAGEMNIFSDDDYITREKPLSFVCLPIMRQDKLHGLLYLENNEVKGAFCAESMLGLELLASQAVILLENVHAAQRFRGLLESAPDAMVIVDTAGKIRFINSQTQALFGYRKEEIYEQTVEVLIPERFRERHAQHRSVYTAHPRFRPMGVGLELCGRRKDGSEFPVDISLSPLCTDDGILVTAAIRDVSDRREAENALKAAEAKYRGIFENAAEGIFRVSPVGRFLDVNPAFARMLGYDSPAELMEKVTDMGRQVWIDPAAITSAIRELRESGALSDFEAEVSCRDDSVIWMRVNARVVRDDKEGFFYEGMAENITEHKHAEEALRLSEARYRALYTDNPGILFTLDTDLKILMVNPLGAAQLGYTPDELEGQPVLSYFHPEDRVAVAEQLRRCLENPSRVSRWQFRKVNKSGETVWVDEVGQAVYDLKGNLNVLMVCQDMTERQRAETALRESELKYRLLNETLEMRINQAVDELREKDRILVIQSRQAVMGEMINNIAHQWRQPLNNLALLAQELHYGYKHGSTTQEMMDTNLKKTMSTIDHMSKTIDDFRNFFRPEKEKVPFRVLERIDKAFSLMEGSFKDCNLKVTVNAGADPVITGFPNEFSQVLINILINARDAFQETQVADPLVLIEVHEEEGKTVLTITDNAGGIPESIIGRIFEPYFTTKGPDKGTGVGLFMSKTIIEKSMNGTLSARNVDGGAQFRIEV